MVHTYLTPFTVFNLIMGAVASLGIVYLLYTQQSAIEYRRFLWFLGAGLLVFAIGGPLTDLFAPTWSHIVHSIAALLVVFGLYDPVHNDLRAEEWTRLLLRRPSQVRDPREWMRPIDERILQLFHTTHLVLTPSIIAYNLEYSDKEVNRRLTELTKHGFVERVERGKYRITDIGEQYLHGTLSELNDNPQPNPNLTD